MNTTLPIFLLNTVLFPKTTLPLRIFEPRYKQMISACLKENSPFGVALIQEGPEAGGVAKPYCLGCLARILEVEKLEDGCMNLLTMGDRRFRIVQEIQAEPYWKAEVEVLEEGAPEEDCSAVSQRLLDVVRTYARLYFLMNRDALDIEEQQESLDALSYRLAALLPVANRDKQSLLESDSLKSRLEKEVEILAAENKRLLDTWTHEKFSIN